MTTFRLFLTAVLLLVASAANARVWLDVHGRETQGKFIRYFDGNVVLQRGNSVITIRFEELCDEDQDYVRAELDKKGEAGMLPAPVPDVEVRLTQPEEERTWTSNDGKRIKAQLVAMTRKKAIFLINGKEVGVPLKRLSRVDQTYVRERMKQQQYRDAHPESTQPPSGNQPIQTTPPNMPNMPNIPGMPNFPRGPGMPRGPRFPSGPGFPHGPGMPGQTPRIPQGPPNVPQQTPEFPQTPDFPQMPTFPQQPTPGVPQNPTPTYPTPSAPSSGDPMFPSFDHFKPRSQPTPSPVPFVPSQSFPSSQSSPSLPQVDWSAIPIGETVAKSIGQVIGATLIGSRILMLVIWFFNLFASRDPIPMPDYGQAAGICFTISSIAAVCNFLLLMVLRTTQPSPAVGLSLGFAVLIGNLAIGVMVLASSLPTSIWRAICIVLLEIALGVFVFCALMTVFFGGFAASQFMR